MFEVKTKIKKKKLGLVHLKRKQKYSFWTNYKRKSENATATTAAATTALEAAAARSEFKDTKMRKKEKSLQREKNKSLKFQSLTE